MNARVAGGLGVVIALLLISGIAALFLTDNQEPGAPTAIPTSDDLSPTPEDTFGSPFTSPSPAFSPSPFTGASPSPTDTFSQAQTSPTPTGGAVTTPSPSPTSDGTAVAMTGPGMNAWIGIIPFGLGALTLRGLRRRR